VNVYDQGEGGAVASSTFIIAALSAPTAVASPSGTITICPGSDQTLSYTGSQGGLSYQWLFGTTALPNASQSFYVAGQPGQYRLVVSNACGTDTSAPISIAYHDVTDPIAEQVGSSLVVTNATDFSSFVWTGPTGAAAGASATINPTAEGEYTVTATDANGCETTASVTFTRVSRADAALAAALSLYPNPASQTATLRWDGFKGQNAELRMTDIQGRVVLQLPITQAETALNISELPAGLYVLQVAQGDARHSLMLVRQ
jgi:hypothetical protein